MTSGTIRRVFVVIGSLLVVGLLEVLVFVAVSDAVSWLGAFVALVVVGAVGAWLVKREGGATWRRVADGINAGRMPTDSVLDGLTLMVAGALLLLPGFLSDLAAIALAIPAVRRFVRARAVAGFERRVASRTAAAGGATFGFGTTGFGTAGFGTAGFGGGPFGTDPFGADRFGTRPRIHDDDVIDLDAEEVFVDEPAGELDPPTDRWR